MIGCGSLVRIHEFANEVRVQSETVAAPDGRTADVLHPDGLSHLQGDQNTACAGAEPVVWKGFPVFVGKSLSVNQIVKQGVKSAVAIGLDLKP